MAAVHDSYKCLPNRVGEMSKILREQHALVYADHNRMEQLRQDVASKSSVHIDAIPEPPKMGELDINSVKDSLYFFA